MATANDVLKIAADEIGYYAPDDPEPGSKYGRWMAELLGEDWLAGPSVNVWWCCIFVSWVLNKAKQSVPGFPSYNTDAAWAKAAPQGVNKNDCRPGDIVIFDWNMGTPATDHIGFVEKNLGNGYIQTIEGNTSGTDWGSQYAGNGVHRRTRNLSVVRYCIRPNYDKASSTTSSSPKTKIASVKFTYKFGQFTNVRDAPSTKTGNKITYFNAGDSWTFDGVVIANGYVWATHIGPKTKKRLYTAIATCDFGKLIS